MGYIEEKLGRLSPAQQQEVEDFIDFLLSRNPPRESGDRLLDSVEIAPDVVLSPRPVPRPAVPQAQPAGDNPIPGEILPGYGTYDETAFPVQEQEPSLPRERKRLIRREDGKARQILD